MPARMTATAWRRGTINALLCLSIFLVIWSLVAKLISTVLRTSLNESFWLAWVVLLCPIFLIFVGTWLHGLRTGGRVLLDCGPHPTWFLFLVNAVLFVAMGFFGTLMGSSLPKSLAVASPVLGVSFGVFWLIMASGRLQIRERGLWQYWGLLRWDKIEWCRWGGDATLVLKAKNRIPFLGRGVCRCRPRTSKPLMNNCRSSARYGIGTSKRPFTIPGAARARPSRILNHEKKVKITK